MASACEPERSGVIRSLPLHRRRRCPGPAGAHPRGKECAERLERPTRGRVVGHSPIHGTDSGRTSERGLASERKEP